MSERDRPVAERLSVLERERSNADDLPDYIPSVARFAQRLRDPSAARLALAAGPHRVWVGPSERNGVECVEVLHRQANAGSGCAFPRHLLAEHGVGGITVSAASGDPGRVVKGVVPDDVLAVHVGDVHAVLSDNVFLLSVRLDAFPDRIVFLTATGVREWRFPVRLRPPEGPS